MKLPDEEQRTRTHRH